VRDEVFALPCMVIRGCVIFQEVFSCTLVSIVLTACVTVARCAGGRGIHRYVAPFASSCYTRSVYTSRLLLTFASYT